MTFQCPGNVQELLASATQTSDGNVVATERALPREAAERDQVRLEYREFLNSVEGNEGGFVRQDHQFLAQKIEQQ